MTQQTEARALETVAGPLNDVRAAVRTRELHELLARRPELHGVYGLADFAAEGVRWSA